MTAAVDEWTAGRLFHARHPLPTPGGRTRRSTNRLRLVADRHLAASDERIRRNRVARFMAIAGGTQALYAPGAVPGSPTFHITTTAGARRASLTWEPTNATVCVATRQAIEEHVTLLNDLEEARAQVRTLAAEVHELRAAADAKLMAAWKRPR